ncbi:MAG: hypothetical protein RLN80_01065, partial [Rhodospirillales bacterium]
QSGLFEERVNREMVLPIRFQTEHWENVCKGLIAEHVRETGSMFAENLLNDWHRERDRFWQVIPTEIMHKLEHPALADTSDEKIA